MEYASELPTPEEIALSNQAEILGAVTRRFQFSESELTLMAGESFFSDTSDSVSFFVRHQTGLYGVNAQYMPDGTLHNITTANLQMGSYFDPPVDTANTEANPQ